MRIRNDEKGRMQGRCDKTNCNIRKIALEIIKIFLPKSVLFLFEKKVINGEEKVIF